MATQWLREIHTTSTGGGCGMPFALKCMALFLQKCLGFTGFAETVSSGSYVSTEKSGTGGSINIGGSDKNFRDDTASAFVVGDIGKWIVIREMTNPENAGIYEITANPDADTVTIDFRTGAAEYPTQNLGDNLDWWLLADNYDMPVTTNDTFELTTPHANAWRLEFVYDNTTAATHNRFSVRLYPGPSFVSGHNAWVGMNNADDSWFYCVADDTGEFVNFLVHNNTSNFYGGFLSGNLTLTESGTRTPAEQSIMMGDFWSTPTYYDTNTWERIYSITLPNEITYGRMWNDDTQWSVCYMIDPSYYLSTDSLSSWTSRQINQRTGNWDFLDQRILQDPDNDGAHYASSEVTGSFTFVGNLKGFSLCSKNAGDKTAVDFAGTKDRFHFFSGHAIPWPGFTPQH